MITNNVTSNQGHQPSNPTVQTNYVPVQVNMPPPVPGNPDHVRNQPLNSQQMVPPGNLASNGDVHHNRSSSGTFSGVHIRNGSINSGPSDGYCSASGVPTTRKEQYRNRDIKTELKDLVVEMDRITLGELLQEGVLF